MPTCGHRYARSTGTNFQRQTPGLSWPYEALKTPAIKGPSKKAQQSSALANGKPPLTPGGVQAILSLLLLLVMFMFHRWHRYVFVCRLFVCMAVSLYVLISF